MATEIDEVRRELAKWEARVAEDESALAAAERQIDAIRDRLASAVECVNSLREAVRKWSAVHALYATPNARLNGQP